MERTLKSLSWIHIALFPFMLCVMLCMWFFVLFCFMCFYLSWQLALYSSLGPQFLTMHGVCILIFIQTSFGNELSGKLKHGLESRGHLTDNKHMVNTKLFFCVCPSLLASALTSLVPFQLRTTFSGRACVLEIREKLLLRAVEGTSAEKQNSCDFSPQRKWHSL